MRTYPTRVGPLLSEGARLLCATMKKAGLSQAAVSTTLSCGEGVVSRWMRGERLPSGPSRSLLFQHFRIPPQSWDQKPKRAFRVAA